jgi:hypothetical protein
MKIISISTILLFSFAASAAEIVEPIGIYQAVSESEWDIEIQLNKDYSAAIITSWWEPGERARASKEKKVGTWRLTNNLIEADFGKTKISFTYEQQLSFEDFDKQGAAPGLIGISGAMEPYKFKGMHFWLQSELSKVSW